MYQISDLYSNLWNKDYKNFSGIGAETIINGNAKWLSDYIETFSFYALTLVISGKIEIKYDGEEIELTKSSLFLYLPGSEFSVILVSDY